jgi:Trypsin-like peptidase domain
MEPHNVTQASICKTGVILRVARLVIFALCAGPFCESAFGQQPGRVDDHAVQLFAVNVLSSPQQARPGLYGIYLGNGLVITAAHVAGHAGSANPIVLVAGRSLEAKFVKEGDFEKVDLTLLSIDARLLPPNLGLRMMPICNQPPLVGQKVVVATPQAIGHSRIMSPHLLPADVRERFNTVIPDVATTGNSGSGVFDAVEQCLMGVMSRKIQTTITTSTMRGAQQKSVRDIAKYFVPAAQIQEFVADSKF